jgi:phosphoserine phosphatase RsbU/P
MKILLADDDVTVRTLVGTLLPKWGHEVTYVSDGSSAWEVLNQPDAPQMAILDWVMPEISGLDLCHRLRSREQPQPLYVVLLTARSQPRDVVQALEMGADEFITKPFHAEELRARIQAGCRILELQAKLRDQERVQGVIQMARTICHEMNQPLQAVLGFSELLLQDVPPTDPKYALLSGVKTGAERLGRITRQIMNLTHAPTKEFLGQRDGLIDLERTRG